MPNCQCSVKQAVNRDVASYIAQRICAAGIVVANDADAQRCNLLAHQTKRMCSPALIVTNHDATMYPIVSDHTAKVSSSQNRISG